MWVTVRGARWSRCDPEEARAERDELAAELARVYPPLPAPVLFDQISAGAPV